MIPNLPSNRSWRCLTATTWKPVTCLSLESFRCYSYNTTGRHKTSRQIIWSGGVKAEFVTRCEADQTVQSSRFSPSTDYDWTKAGDLLYWEVEAMVPLCRSLLSFARRSTRRRTPGTCPDCAGSGICPLCNGRLDLMSKCPCSGTPSGRASLMNLGGPGKCPYCRGSGNQA